MNLFRRVDDEVDYIVYCDSTWLHLTGAMDKILSLSIIKMSVRIHTLTSIQTCVTVFFKTKTSFCLKFTFISYLVVVLNEKDS